MREKFNFEKMYLIFETNNVSKKFWIFFLMVQQHGAVSILHFTVLQLYQTLISTLAPVMIMKKGLRNMQSVLRSTFGK